MTDASPLHVEFTYTAGELREATRVARRHVGRGRHGNLLVPWVAVVCCAIVAAYWFYDPPDIFRSRVHGLPGLGSRLLGGMAPIAVCAVYAVLNRLPGRLTAAGRALVASPMQMWVDSGGVASEHDGATTRVAWSGLDRFIETDHLLTVRLVNGRGWFAIPKRAVTDPGQLDAMRSLLAEGTSVRTGGFPALPLEAPRA